MLNSDKSKIVKLDRKCDFCDKDAFYDGKTIMGPWGYMCQDHFNHFGVKIKGLFTQIKEK